MHFQPKMLIATGYAPRTARQVAAMAGYSDVKLVYKQVANGQAIAGILWRWADPEEIAEADRPQPSEFGKTKRLIVCGCRECEGKVWTVNEIRALPGVNNRAIAGHTFPGINGMTGHLFAYHNPKAIGDWRKNGEATHEAQPDPTRRHVRNCDPEAMELLPYHPMGPGWHPMAVRHG
jgi:hypothetical protein